MSRLPNGMDIRVPSRIGRRIDELYGKYGDNRGENRVGSLNEAGYRLRETIYPERADRADRAAESGSPDNSVFPRPTKDFARRAV